MLPAKDARLLLVTTEEKRAWKQQQANGVMEAIQSSVNPKYQLRLTNTPADILIPGLCTVCCKNTN